ncbi:MAG: formate dehydrogenase accessory protein FdhE [Candidatus Sulfotelmatobacter sp.]
MAFDSKPVIDDGRKADAAGLRPRFSKNYNPRPLPQSMLRKPYFGEDFWPTPVACRESRPHNRPVGNTLWQQRIRRAENLAAQHSFAQEILAFYIHAARFQEGICRRIESRRAFGQSSAGASPLSSRPLLGHQDADEADRELLASFPLFLTVVEEHGPERLSQVAADLRSAHASAWSDLLNAIWSAVDEPPSNPEGFLAFTFLQPYAELARSHSRPQLDGYTHHLCPFCNRKPGLGVLRPLGDGAQRRLVCGFCLAEWEFRRIVCPGCGEENHAKLPVYTAETFPHIRVECCDTCHTYIKSVDLTRNGLADPLVDELASIPLDLWAQEHGYNKLHPNQFGM